MLHDTSRTAEIERRLAAITLRLQAVRRVQDAIRIGRRIELPDLAPRILEGLPMPPRSIL